MSIGTEDDPTIFNFKLKQNFYDYFYNLKENRERGPGILCSKLMLKEKS